MAVIFDNIFRNKKVLVTGHTGFKGGWLSLWLKELGAQVTGFALKPVDKPNFFEACHFEKGIVSIIGDIRDRQALDGVFKRFRPEIVFHLAAQPLVRYSYREPVETYETNVLGTVNTLEACRQNSSVKTIVNITSDKCYENQERGQGYREDDPMGGCDPYSSSKGCAELVAKAYLRSYFRQEQFSSHNKCLASVRAGNVLGGGDWSTDRLIPDCVRAFVENNSVVIRNPKSIRPWQHVLEPLSGYLFLAQRMLQDGPEFSGAWNFGPDKHGTQTVGWVVDRFGQMWGGGASWEEDQKQHPHETRCLKLDCSKARSSLKWRPQWSLDVALEKTVDWYKSFYAGRNMQEMCLQQISEYEQRMNEETDALPVLP